MTNLNVIVPRVGDPDNESYAFHCPGCNKLHVFNAAGKPPLWEFNHDLVKPTIKPSIGTTLYDGKYCHCYVTNGMIQFLTDSWHHLKGRTVPLEPVFKET